MSTILKAAIKPVLANDILEVLKSPPSDDAAKQQEMFAEKLAEVISQTIAVEIQNYLTTNIQVQVTVAPGISVATTGTPAAQTGTTTSPGTGVGRLIAAEPRAFPAPSPTPIPPPPV